MGRTRFILTNILFWVILFICGFVVENLAFMTTHMSEGLDDTSLFLILGAGLITALVYFISEHKKNRLKVNYLWMLLILAMLGLSLYTIWRQPGSYTFTNPDDSFTDTIEITLHMKITSSIQVSGMFLTLYIFLVPQKKNYISFLSKKWLYWCYILYTVGTITYSLITEMPAYISWFTTDNPIRVQSFYVNPNTYGYMTMQAVLVLIVMQTKRPHWYNTLLMLVFTIFGAFTACASTTLLTGLAFVIYCIFSWFSALKKHLIRSLIVMIITLISLIGIVVTVGCLYQLGVEWLVKISDSIVHFFVDNETIGIFSFGSREKIWDCSRTLMTSDILSFLFGYGFKLGAKVMCVLLRVRYDHALPINGIHSCHSSFYELFLNGGLFMVVFYYGLLLYALICIIILFAKKKGRFAFLFLISLLVISAHGIVESSNFVEGNMKSLSYMYFFYLPIISEAYLSKKKTKEQLETFKYDSPFFRSKMEPKYAIQFATSLIIIALFACVPILVSDLSLNSGAWMIITNIMVALGISLLFAPYLLYIWSKETGPVRFKIRLIINTIVIAAVPFGLTILFRGLALFDLVIWVVPLSYAGILLLDALFFSIVKKGSIKLWFKNIMEGIFVTNWIANILAIGTTILFSLLFVRSLMEQTWLSLMLCSITSGLTHILLILVIKNKRKTKMLDHFNDEILAYYRRKEIKLDYQK